MLAQRLINAMDDYLAALAELQQWDLSGEDSTPQRETLRTARRGLLEAVDDAAAEATSGSTAGASCGLAVAAEAAVPRRIFVALDDSDHAAWCVQAATKQALLAGADIVLLHVINPSATLSADFAATYAYDAVRAQQRQKAEELIDATAALVPAAVHVERLVREGAAAHEIVAAAREWEADLIVMGTRGRGRLATFLLGSTAEEVIRRAHCPVLTVGHDPTPPTAGDSARSTTAPVEVVAAHSRI